MSEPVSVVIPARNEAGTIATVVRRLKSLPWVDEIVVVDNGSEDQTAATAERAGARTVFEPVPGMGNAVRAGFAAARNDWVMKLDADLERFDTDMLARMPAARGPGIGLVKGAWNDPDDNMPMTRLLVMPAINLMFAGLSHLRAPNSGIYLANRSCFAHQELIGNYAADLDVMLRVHAAGAQVAEVEIGRIRNDPRTVGHYNAMAEVIMRFFLSLQEKKITEELVVMAEDAGQVIRNCLGVLGKRSKSGGLVTVLLAQADGPESETLRAALAPFPTARVMPLDQAGGFEPVGPAGRLRLFAPYPAAHENQAIRAALQVQAQLGATLESEPDLLLMPLGPDRGAVDGFRADVAMEVGEGAPIKQAAIEKIADRVRPGDSPAMRSEMFQSFASLPDPLKIALIPDAGLGVRSM